MYRTEIGSQIPIGDDLSDDELLRTCEQDGDSKGTLAFLLRSSMFPTSTAISPPVPSHDTDMRGPNTLGSDSGNDPKSESVGGYEPDDEAGPSRGIGSSLRSASFIIACLNQPKPILYCSHPQSLSRRPHSLTQSPVSSPTATNVKSPSTAFPQTHLSCAATARCRSSFATAGGGQGTCAKTARIGGHRSSIVPYSKRWSSRSSK